MRDDLSEWVSRANNAQSAANKMLADLGYLQGRVAGLNDIVSKLDCAPADVQEYFLEAVLCLRNDLTRAAIVFSWAGHFSLFCERLYAEKENAIRVARPKWDFSNKEELMENPEAQIIEVAKHADVKFIKKSKARMLDGWLSQRNLCAHPTVYKPDGNTAIGYVSSMVDEVLNLT